MSHESPNFDWSPSTVPVVERDFDEYQILVLHYWAAWDKIDREMDKLLATLREEYVGRICFRSCDVDRAENQAFINEIANIPALGCFIGGKWFNNLIGLRSVDELRSMIEAWMWVADTLANHIPQQP